jgi:hypothetical protein
VRKDAHRLSFPPAGAELDSATMQRLGDVASPSGS